MSDLEMLTELYKPYIKDAAKRTSRRVYHLDTDDIEQALWVWFYEEGYKTIERALTRSRKVEPGAIINKAANRFVDKELDDYRQFQGNYCYQPSDIRRMLKQLGEGQSMEHESRIDIEGALEIVARVAPAQYKAITAQYYGGETLTSTQRANVSRGVDLITKIINENNADTLTRVEVEELTNL